MLFQVAFLLFSALTIFKIWSGRRASRLSVRAAIGWSVFWLIADAVVLFPDNTVVLANTFGIGRGVDFIVYIAIIVLFAVVFRLHIKMAQLEEHLTSLVRQDAIDHAKK